MGVKAKIITYLFSTVILTVTIQFTATAQTFKTNTTADPKAVSLYKEASQASGNRRYEDAKKLYFSALKKEPGYTEPMIGLAGLYNSDGKNDSVILMLSKVIELDPNPSARVLFTLASSYFSEGEYTQAKPLLEKYLRADAKNSNSLEKAKVMLTNTTFAIEAKQNPVPFEARPLSAQINSPQPEYLPSISADGKVLVFTRTTDKQEDLYYSLREGDGWTEAALMPGINTPRFNEGAQAISPDGKVLVFTGCGHPGGFGNCDLYISYLNNGTWTRPVNMGENINTRGWESQPAFSPDGNTLFFSSERDLGYGRRDIWYSERSPSGKWKTPVNLGAPVNTTSSEGSPFMAADNETLYFMSDGHPGMGGMDLFMTRRQGKDVWSTPVNLGYPINTRGIEGAMVVNTAGDTAFFTSTGSDKKMTNQGLYDSDIYYFVLHEKIRPRPASYFRAIVLDAESSQPVRAQVNITGITSGQPLMRQRTDVEGSVLMPLPAGEDYGIQLYAPGYIFISDHFSIPAQLSDFKPYEQTFYLDKIDKHLGKPMVMRNIYFETGSATLDSVSLAEIGILAEALRYDAALKATILGHTDNVGSEKDNQMLSEQRAQSVIRALVKMGIPAARLSATGHGESRPLASNETDEGRSQNRRTEVVFTR